jgi:hypothetical protein
MIVMGIDPGSKGALVVLSELSTTAYCFSKNTWEEIAEEIKNRANYGEEYGESIDAYVEAVAALPKDGAHNAFTFGENTGIIKGILIANGIEFIEVHSQKWQRHFGLGAKYPSKTARKNAQKAKAQELFPDIKVTLDIADALLITKYGYDTMLR